MEAKLKTRALAKKRKPTFKRVQSRQFAKLKDTKWRKPKGMGNKVRRNRRGKPSQPTVGYGSPKEVRGLNHKGQKEILISSISSLDSVDSKSHSVIISSKVGSRKRLELLNKAKTLKINVSNVKDIDLKIKELTKESKSVKKETKPEEKKEVKSDTKSDTKSKEKKTDVKEAKK